MIVAFRRFFHQFKPWRKLTIDGAARREEGSYPELW
jgi:hypothetical protein